MGFDVRDRATGAGAEVDDFPLFVFALVFRAFDAAKDI